MSAPTTPSVRIISTPPGEAPEQVRRAWIGLELPLADGGPRTVHSAGVVSGPRGFIGTLFGLASGGVKETKGWVVKVRPAMAILAERAPEAEAWWRQNVPRLFEGDRSFVFAASCGELVGGAAPAAEHPPTGKITAATPTAKMLRAFCVLLAIDLAIPLAWYYHLMPVSSIRLWIVLILTAPATLVLALFLVARMRAVKARELERQM